MLYLRTDYKQNYFPKHSFNPTLCKAHSSKQTGIVPLHENLLALISRGLFCELTFYLWLWNKILTHLNFSFKGPLISCQWVTSRYSFLSAFRQTLHWLSKEVDSDLNLPIYLVDHCSCLSFCSSQTEGPLSKSQLKAYVLLLFFFLI